MPSAGTLPEIILGVDAEVRFSWIMLGREPRSASELLMVYGGILAYGTALSAAETAPMIPQLSAPAVRQAMKWASDERRLAEACRAVLTFMHRHAIAATWGRSDLASSDMMSLETAKRVWQARLDPRRQTPAIGIYSHVRDRWGIFNAPNHLCSMSSARPVPPSKASCAIRSSRSPSSRSIPTGTRISPWRWRSSSAWTCVRG